MKAAPEAKIIETWLTRKPNALAGSATTIVSLLLFAFSFLFFSGILGADGWMAASAREVFDQGEYWRLWTTLFAHADMGHLLSNAFLFIPLAYMLTSHFSLFFFPVTGILLGGLINALVLLTLPREASLIGISGVVYWMGASWLTLYLLIDRRDRLRRRFGAALFLTLMLFVPETLRPEVSHLSHLLGYVTGAASAFLYYAFCRQRFLCAEKRVFVYEPEFADPSEAGAEDEPDFFVIHN